MVIQLSNIVSATVASFIDYALIAVTIMTIYYVFKLFTVDSLSKEEKEAELQQQREAWGGAFKKIKGKYDEKVTNQEKKRYQAALHNQSRPIINNLKHATEAADKVIAALDRKDSAAAIREIKEFDSELRRAFGSCRLLRSKAKEDDLTKVKKIITEIDAIRSNLAQNVLGKIPHKVDSKWNGTITPIRAAVISLRGSTGAIFNKVEELSE